MYSCIPLALVAEAYLVAHFASGTHTLLRIHELTRVARRHEKDEGFLIKHRIICKQNFD